MGLVSSSSANRGCVGLPDRPLLGGRSCPDRGPYSGHEVFSDRTISWRPPTRGSAPTRGEPLCGGHSLSGGQGLLLAARRSPLPLPPSPLAARRCLLVVGVLVKIFCLRRPLRGGRSFSGGHVTPLALSARSCSCVQLAGGAKALIPVPCPHICSPHMNQT